MGYDLLPQGAVLRDPAPTPEWYSIGLALAANPGLGVIRDPLGLASGPPVYDPVTGDITVPLNTGIIAATPATGWSVTIPAKTDLLRDPRATATFLRGALRGWLTAFQGTSGALRCGVCVMSTANPTTANGWGPFTQKNNGVSTLSAGVSRGSAGAWTLTPGGTSVAGAPAEGTISQYSGSTQSFGLATATSSVTGISAGSGGSATNIPTVSAATPVYLCFWFGSTDGLITAGDYTARGLAALQDVPTADFVGRA